MSTTITTTIEGITQPQCHPPSPTTPALLSTSHLLLKISFFCLSLALFIGHFVSGIPRRQLGRRPVGLRVVRRFYDHLIRNVGVKGYDSSLGSFSYSVKLLFYIAGYVSLWSFGILMLVGWKTFGGEDDDGVCLLTKPKSLVSEVQDMGVLSLLFFVMGSFLYFMLGKGVSDPGGPREKKIQRVPMWDDKDTFLPERNNIQWRCAVAEDSHRVTHERFGIKGNEPRFQSLASGRGPGGEKEMVTKGLSGEPFGRQMWTCGDGSKFYEEDKSSYVDDDEMVTLFASGGRQGGFNPSKNPNSCDQIFRAQQIRSYLATGKSPPDLNWKPETPLEAARKGTHFYSMLQTDDGHWAGDYGGPHFLMPGIIITWYVIGKPKSMLDENQVLLMTHYLTVHQQSDGGWGTHIESPSTMFGTVLCYVSLRLLGMNADHPVCQKGRRFIREEDGGALMTSSWAKFWLCVLGCMEWEGHNSVPPEMWLLPNWFPFHPGRLWCHCRMVYLPMGYLYGVRFVYGGAETDSVIAELRKELYKEPYNSIKWSHTRHLVSPKDNYSPIPLIMKIAQNFLSCYESWSIFQPLKNAIRKRGLAFSREYMAAEDLQTNYIDIGPVNKVMNLLSAFHSAKNDVTAPTVQNHMMRIPDYLWIAEDGMKMQGYNGSQCWDTSFGIQALAECDLLDSFPDVSKKVWAYLERTQILSTKTSQSSSAYTFESPLNRDRFYRHVSEGGWPFSTSAHGWPISDCTGEGLKGVLALQNCAAVTKGTAKGDLVDIPERRLFNAVNVILNLQNEDGGWATYENNRGFGWYESLNPSEVFGDIMIDYSYVECSMASLTALVEFSHKYPTHREQEIKYAVHNGKQFIKSIQRDDGSWYGSWACCFCYACWFGVEGLVLAGEPTDSVTIKKCCAFLLKQQRDNGGWGEDFTSCYDKDYAQDGMKQYGDDGSGVVNTAWALLALSMAKCDDVTAIRKGVSYLMKRQLPTGDWPQEGISGVFNRACGITYTAYRNVFPIWALGRCAKVYGSSFLQKKK